MMEYCYMKYECQNVTYFCDFSYFYDFPVIFVISLISAISRNFSSDLPLEILFLLLQSEGMSHMDQRSEKLWKMQPLTGIKSCFETEGC